MQKKKKIDIFESVLYTKSGSMPLIVINLICRHISLTEYLTGKLAGLLSSQMETIHSLVFHVDEFHFCVHKMFMFKNWKATLPLLIWGYKMFTPSLGFKLILFLASVWGLWQAGDSKNMMLISFVCLFTFLKKYVSQSATFNTCIYQFILNQMNRSLNLYPPTQQEFSCLLQYHQGYYML